jgi:RNA polymerase sigma-70 factor (ECF subfamily)
MGAMPELATDGAAFRQLFDANAAYVVASLGRFGVAPSDHDDLMVEVFVRVHRALHTYDPARPIRPWLCAFVARVASEHRKLARHRREVAGTEHEGEAAGTPDSALEAHEARHLVAMALAALDDDKRTVFVLHELDEIAVPEIALALSIAEGTAYSRLRAARAEFAAAVRRYKSSPAFRAAVARSPS